MSGSILTEPVDFYQFVFRVKVENSNFQIFTVHIKWKEQLGKTLSDRLLSVLVG